MKSFFVCLLAAAALLFTGCTYELKPNNAPSDTPPDSAPVEAPQTAAGLAFFAQYIRTDGLFMDMDYPAAFLIDSADALMDYYQHNQYDYGLEKRIDAPTDRFEETMPVYDDAFFETYLLAIVRFEEPSGSIRHNITQAVLHNGIFTISIERIRPQIGTSDMAQWHIFVELPRESAASGVQLDVTKIDL